MIYDFELKLKAGYGSLFPMNMVEVMCPTCGEWFSVAGPSEDECPTEWDYDCEVCCRPMVIVFDGNGEAWARGMADG